MSIPPIRITEAARAQILELARAKGLDDIAVRLLIPDLAARRYGLRFVPRAERTEDDVCVESEGVMLFIDGLSASRLADATLDFVDDLQRSGFRLDNPKNPALSEFAARVQRVLDEQVLPMVAEHGGTVLLIEAEDGRVVLELGGGCQGCGMADLTLKEGIEKVLRTEIPEIIQVLDVTDHGAGANPYVRR
jgi:Fe/S biogenesis protein NfuA